jgi:hypothetical protein
MNKEALKEFIDGIDEKTEIVVIHSKDEFEKLVQPNLSRSVIYRVGKHLAVCLKTIIGIATIWILAHDQFPDYVPNAQRFIAISYEYVQPIFQSVKTDRHGLVPNEKSDVDYKFVDLGTGILPLSVIPPEFSKVIRPSGQAYI